jgi:hypothetical protein
MEQLISRAKIIFNGSTIQIFFLIYRPVDVWNVDVWNVEVKAH